jgi:hypothetical protein
LSVIFVKRRHPLLEIMLQVVIDHDDRAGAIRGPEARSDGKNVCRREAPAAAGASANPVAVLGAGGY